MHKDKHRAAIRRILVRCNESHGWHRKDRNLEGWGIWQCAQSFNESLGGLTINTESHRESWISSDGCHSFLDPSTGYPLAIVISPAGTSEGIRFMTNESEELQIGLLRWNAGHRIEAHSHRPLRRVLESTTEVLFVRSGKVEMALYTSEGDFLSSRVLNAGDVVALFRGGHGFRILEDADIVEVKQGPYTGIDEKYRFPSIEAD